MRILRMLQKCYKRQCSTHLASEEDFISSRKQPAQARVEKDPVESEEKDHLTARRIPRGLVRTYCVRTFGTVRWEQIMEHARKFVIVDPKFTIKEKTLSKLDDSIREILNSELSDDIKVKNYMQTLRRYRAFDTENKPQEKLSDKEILKFVPFNSKHKATRILAYLQRDPDLRFSDEGELIYRQDVIRGTNVAELLGDLYQRNSSFPSGWEEIAKSLKRQNVDKELIVNKDVLRYIYPPKARREATPARKTTPIAWEPYDVREILRSRLTGKFRGRKLSG